MDAAIVPLALFVLVISVYLFQILGNEWILDFGIYPRTFIGLRGIFFAPLIHSSLEHLFSNLSALLILGTGIYYFFTVRYNHFIFFGIWIFTNVLVWIFARSSFHVGASGLVYGYASFLFFSGFFTKNTPIVALSLLIALFYGGLIWGLLPLDIKISFESHLAGAISGFVFSIFFNKRIKILSPSITNDYPPDTDEWNPNLDKNKPGPYQPNKDNID